MLIWSGGSNISRSLIGIRDGVTIMFKHNLLNSPIHIYVVCYIRPSVTFWKSPKFTFPFSSSYGDTVGYDAVWDILIFATYSTSLNIQFISYSSFKIFGAVFSAILKPSKSNSFIYYCHGFRVEPERKTCYRRKDRGI